MNALDGAQRLESGLLHCSHLQAGNPPGTDLFCSGLKKPETRTGSQGELKKAI